MSCLSVTLSRVGAVSVEAERKPSGVAAGLRRSGAPVPVFMRLPGLLTALERVSVRASLARVCERDIKVPYLEIEPTILWVYPDWATSNNVLSNTHWRIN